MKAKIAVVQFDSVDSQDKNLLKMEQMIKEAAANEADLIAFPEHADYLGKEMEAHAVGADRKNDYDEHDA